MGHLRRIGSGNGRNRNRHFDGPNPSCENKYSPGVCCTLLRRWRVAKALVQIMFEEVTVVHSYSGNEGLFGLSEYISPKKSGIAVEASASDRIQNDGRIQCTRIAASLLVCFAIFSGDNGFESVGIGSDCS